MPCRKECAVVPTWAWVLLVLALIIWIPIKMHILKNMLAKRQKERQQDRE